MSAGKQISIILPSFRDERILDAIASVRAFDDADATKIIIIDGGSDEGLLGRIRSLLTEHDVLVAEPDKGIFDGLNKGLDRVDTPYMGWIGSDDLYAADAKSSKVLAGLANHDLYVMDLVLVRDGRIRRRTHSWPCSVGMVKWGLHNPHYSTWGRSALLTKYRFRLDLLGSDIDYFLNVFSEKPRVLRDPAVGLLMAEGGFSSEGYKKSVRINRQLFASYRRHVGSIGATAAMGMKTVYKVSGLLANKLRRRRTDRLLQPELRTGNPHPARASS